MSDVEKAKIDPASVFRCPEDIVADKTVSTKDKIKILRRWEYDQRNESVAIEENMPGEDSDIIDRIHKALHELGGDVDVERGPPTKQGGE